MGMRLQLVVAVLLILLAVALLVFAGPVVPLAVQAQPAGSAIATSPASATALAAADALRLLEQDRPFFRYLWDPERSEDFRTVLSLHLNLLSDQPFLIPPYLVTPGLYRIDLRDYGHDRRFEVFERFAGLDPYFHVKVKASSERVITSYWPGGKWDVDGKVYEAGKHPFRVSAGVVVDLAAPWTSAPVEVAPNRFEAAIDVLRRELRTEVPILYAQWYFVQTARQISIRNRIEGVGYYEWLGIKDRDSFFQLAGVDRQRADKLFANHRAVVLKSGISNQNRQIVRLGAISGSAWGTLDAFHQEGRGIARRNLRDGEFDHNAERWYGVLPNGLFVTGLFSVKGETQASAPDQVGPDDSPLNTSRDMRVHANLSCLRCHAQNDWLRSIDDWARLAFRVRGPLRLQEPDRKIFGEVAGQYLRDIDGHLSRDRAGYQTAVATATTRPGRAGLQAAKIASLYARAWDDYVQKGVTPAGAALELGVSEATWLAALERYSRASGKLDLVLSDHLDNPPRPIPRLDWEASYPFAAAIVSGVLPPEQTLKVKEKVP